MTTRRIAACAAMLVLLAGCGSGSDDPQPAPETTAAPKEYTREQLEAAFPTVEDVPGGTEVSFDCSETPDSCQTGGDEQPTGILIDVEPVSSEAAQAASDAAPAEPVDGAAVSAALFPDTDAAAAGLDDLRERLSEYEGEYETAPETVAGTEVPGQQGVGAITELTIGPWEGFALTRTVVPPSGSEPVLLATQTFVASGATLIGSVASLSAGGREPDAAEVLADSLLRDYLERLG